MDVVVDEVLGPTRILIYWYLLAQELIPGLIVNITLVIEHNVLLCGNSAAIVVVVNRSEVPLGVTSATSFTTHQYRAHICTCLPRSSETKLRFVLLMLNLDLISLWIDTLHMHRVVTRWLNGTTNWVILCLLYLYLAASGGILDNMLRHLLSILQVCDLSLCLAATLSDSLNCGNDFVFLLFRVLLLVAWRVRCQGLLLLNHSTLFINFELQNSIIGDCSCAVRAPTKALVLIQRSFSDGLVGNIGLGTLWRVISGINRIVRCLLTGYLKLVEAIVQVGTLSILIALTGYLILKNTLR